MASDTDDSEAAADRLEAALERISEVLARPAPIKFHRSTPNSWRRDSTH
jgi:hypothetical protein